MSENIQQPFVPNRVTRLIRTAHRPVLWVVVMPIIVVLVVGLLLEYIDTDLNTQTKAIGAVFLLAIFAEVGWYRIRRRADDD